jgi:hypothetical protein
MAARNVWRLLQEALIDGEEADLASGQAIKFIPQVNDQGSFVFGNATKDADVKIFLGADGSYALFDSGAKKFTLSGVTAELGAVTASGAITLTGVTTISTDGYIAEKVVTEATAARTIDETDYSATVVLTKPDGATTVTLPTPAAGITGVRVRVVSTTDQSHVLTCATSDKLITLNNATADSVSCDQASQKIGAIVEAVCTGTAWAILPIAGTWTITDAA